MAADMDVVDDGTAACIQQTVDDYAAAFSKTQLRDDETEDSIFVTTSTLPVYLFDHGYDIWLNGNRGTFAQTETLTDSEPKWDNPEYWQFDYTTMAEFDIPAILSYIQEETGED